MSKAPREKPILYYNIRVPFYNRIFFSTEIAFFIIPTEKRLECNMEKDSLGLNLSHATTICFFHFCVWITNDPVKATHSPESSAGDATLKILFAWIIEFKKIVDRVPGCGSVSF